MSRSRVEAYTTSSPNTTPINRSPPAYPSNHLQVPPQRSPPHHQQQYQQPPPRPPVMPLNQDRDSTFSTASMPFSNIGKMLSQPYDSDSEPEEGPVLSPQIRKGQPQNTSTQTRTGASPVRNVHLQQSPVQGGLMVPGGSPVQVAPRMNMPTPVLPPKPHLPPKYPQASRPTLLPHQQNQRSQHDQYHPAPAPHPQHQQINRPRPTINTSPSYLQPHPLPQPSTPISPALAAPPLSTSSSLNSLSSLVNSYPTNDHGVLSPPRSMTGTTGSRDSTLSTSDSIRGFDAMKEKKALFRGGDDELLSPISPRPRREQPNGRGVGQGMRRTVVGMPGGEFWKRFSVMVRVDDMEKAGGGGKDSAWLEKDQKRKRKVKIAIIISTVALIIILIAIVVGVMLAKSKNPTSSKGIKSAVEV